LPVRAYNIGKKNVPLTHSAWQLGTPMRLMDDSRRSLK